MRRWTDLIWTGVSAVHRFEGHQVKYIYYGLLAVYWVFGLLVLICFPNPFAMVKVASIIFNYALGFSALHTLVVNCTLLPPVLRPGWLMRSALVCACVFFTVVAGIATLQYLNQ
jgi:hypothetical protein